MGTKNQSSGQISDPKKRRRVGFSKTDAGIEAKECIKIYLVSSKEEVESPESFCIEPVDLNQFFDEDGKIYGYQGLKITIWVSSISFHAHADITFESMSDAGKGITDLKSSLQNVFADNLVENKNDFLKTFSTEGHCIKSFVSNGEVWQPKALGYGGDSNLEVIRVPEASVGHIYCRLVPLVLLLVDGSNPIDITDPSWELYVLVQKKTDQTDCPLKLLGFAALYRFFHYPDSLRLRLSQILVLPPYQCKGYGRCLLEVLTNIAVTQNVYDLSIEEPLDSLQHVRTCIDVPRLLAFDPIQTSLSSVVLRIKQENLAKRTEISRFGPPLDAVEDVRKSLKINKKQFLQCWEVLIYIHLDHIDKYMENYRTIVLDRIKADVIGKDSAAAGKRVIEIPSEYNPEVSFVMFKTQDGEPNGIEMENDKGNVEEQLQQLVDERMKEIKLIAEKVSVNAS